MGRRVYANDHGGMSREECPDLREVRLSKGDKPEVVVERSVREGLAA
jgi:hypothetical protein